MRRAGFLVAAVAALLGCGPDYDRTEITGIVATPLGGEINYSRVVVRQGTLIKAHIVSIDSDNRQMASQIHSADPTILEAIQVAGDRDYAFLGIRPGQTTVEIRADDRTVLILDAIVTEQPAF